MSGISARLSVMGERIQEILGLLESVRPSLASIAVLAPPAAHEGLPSPFDLVPHSGYLIFDDNSQDSLSLDVHPGQLGLSLELGAAVADELTTVDLPQVAPEELEEAHSVPEVVIAPEAVVIVADSIQEDLLVSVFSDIRELMRSLAEILLVPSPDDGWRHAMFERLLSLKGLLGVSGASRARAYIGEWEASLRLIAAPSQHDALPQLAGLQDLVAELEALVPPSEEVVADEADRQAGAGSFLDLDWLNEDIAEESPQELVKVDDSGADEEEEEEDVILLEILPLAMEEVEELVPAIDDGLAALAEGRSDVIGDLHRKIHTLKGTVGMAGSRSARTLLHDMETKMEDLGAAPPAAFVMELQRSFLLVKERIKVMASAGTGDVPVIQADGSSSDAVQQQAVQAKKTVRVQAQTIDELIGDINEARLVNSSLLEQLGTFRGGLEDLENNSQRIGVMLRELDMHAESQIQSRRTQLAETGEEFDPLELDRFTRLQELSRLLSEGVSDILEVYREMSRVSSDQETMLASQRRVLQATQHGLHRTRLTPFEAINDTLYTVVWKTAHELHKEVEFNLTGGRVELDRVFLEKIVTPLHHILRNSLAHGIEMPEERVAAGKPRHGKIEVQVRQEAGRALISVNDDGGGIQVERVRKRAVERGIWPADRPMDDRQAADMICQPGFSTATEVSQISGRGVGMDVVRSDILAMGGRFDLHSVEGHGLMVVIQLPTSIATAAVLVVEGGGESWALPIDTVEHIVRVRGEELQEARQNGVITISLQGEAELPGIPFVSLQDLTHVWDPSWMPGTSAPVVLARDGDRWMAIEVSRLHPVIEAPLRPLGRPWSKIKGFAGSVVLADGRAIFLLDPFRMPLPSHGTAEAQSERAAVAKVPLVLVVDDSVTVRKATERFLSKQGIASVLAKDGQEALDILVGLRPDLVLLDVEMPRMDGFVCAKNIRESARHHDLPIVMITSRTADKHRQRAMDIGVNEYLGKPFNEEELLEVLERFVHKKAEPKPQTGWTDVKMPFAL